MPHFTMTVGLPGSGKSTWARLQDDTVVVSTDEIFDEYAERDGITYTEAFNKYSFSQVEKEMKSRMNKAFAEDKNVILDQTNMTIKSRSKKLKDVPKHYTTRAVVFELDDTELFKRLRRRAMLTGKEIPPAAVYRFKKSYEPPSEFDEVITING